MSNQGLDLRLGEVGAPERVDEAMAQRMEGRVPVVPNARLVQVGVQPFGSLSELIPIVSSAAREDPLAGRKLEVSNVIHESKPDQFRVDRNDAGRCIGFQKRVFAVIRDLDQPDILLLTDVLAAQLA